MLEESEDDLELVKQVIRKAEQEYWKECSDSAAVGVLRDG